MKQTLPNGTAEPHVGETCAMPPLMAPPRGCSTTQPVSA